MVETTVGTRYRRSVAVQHRRPDGAEPALAAAGARRAGLRWAGYAGAAWAALAVPAHLQAALVGRPGPGELAWRVEHWAAALLLGLLALHTLALVSRWGRVLPDWVPGVGGRRVPSGVMILPAFATAVLALASAARWLLGGVAGGPDSLTFVERGALDLLSFLGHGPWALGLGVLVALAAADYVGESEERSNTERGGAGVRRLGGMTARRIWLVVLALGVLRLLLGIDPL
jgi:hypothetical protein